MKFLTHSAAIGLAAVLLVLFAPNISNAAVPNQSSLSLSLIRAVRISSSTITISFKTNQPAIGILKYSTVDGGEITLTDSAAEADHLFTIDSLNASHGYTFILKAQNEAAKSNAYSVLLAPETIGPPGASEMPNVQELDAQGAVISSILSSSTTPLKGSLIPNWAYGILIVLVAVGYGIYLYYHHTKKKALIV